MTEVKGEPSEPSLAIPQVRGGQQAGKHEHAGHSEDVLQPEDQELARRQAIIDASLENPADGDVSAIHRL